MAENNSLLAALERTLQQTENEADRRMLADAVLAGQFAAIIGNSSQAWGAGSAAVGGNLDRSMIITGNNNQLYITLPQDSVALLQRRIFPTPPGVPPPLTAQLMFVGRDKDMSHIQQELGIGSEAPTKRVLIVRGWPGVGKTTLVGMLGRDPGMAQAFPDGVLWTVVDQSPRPIDALARWGRALGTDSLMRAATLSEAVEQMQDLLRDKRMLLIVDDVWQSDDAVPFLQAAGEHCSVLVTTRITQVADQLDAVGYNTHFLPVLAEEDAFQLLSLLAPTVTKAQPEQCRGLVQDLECLPLAIHVVGRILSSKSRRGWPVDVTQFRSDLEKDARLLQERAPTNRAENGRIPTVQALLQKSTDMLSEQNREYFAYLGAFAPKPATFDLDAMRAVWEEENPRPTADVLIDHGLLEPIILESTDTPRFQMHALLVSHARSLCEDDEAE